MGTLISIFKFSVYFAISFLILCIPVQKDSKVFDYIEVAARPLTSKIFFFINKKTEEGIQEGKQITKKIFTNAAPVVKDQIKSALSSAKKKVLEKEEKNENYTEEEKEAIKKILSNQY